MEQAVKKTYNVGVISLGCDKNRVDTEKMLYKIKNYGHNIVNDVTVADVIIVNSCAFLQSSRQETVNTAIDAYKNSNGKPVIMTGCMPQKFIDEFYDTFTEVSGFLGTNDYDRILEVIEIVIQGKRFNGVKTVTNFSDNTNRVLTTDKHYAFLMIADGCNNRCTYCLIPYIRGSYRSYSIEKIVKEAENLVNGGVKELILVAQDVTRYGKDLYGEYSLVKLLKELSKINGLGKNSIRLLYCYPELVNNELIAEIKNNEKIIKYLDIPMQHISDRILKLMGRRSDSKKIKELINFLRSQIEDISIRSTFIVGFPSETEEDFEMLCDFLKEYKIDNAGFFAYSREEGTPSYDFKPQINPKTKQRRLKAVNLIQQDIYFYNNSQQKGNTIDIICDGFDTEKTMYKGRTSKNAPLSDKAVFFTSESPIIFGEHYCVEVNSFDVYDLFGKAVNA